MAREVEKNFLPQDYEGRCIGEECFSTFLSKGGKLSEGEILRKYEIRLPIPSNNEQAQEFYDLALSDLVRMGVAKLATAIDDKVKPTLFDGEGNATDESHLAAQVVADSWRYRARVARGKSVEVAELLHVLVSSGKLSEEEAEGITTKAELMAALM